LIRISQRISDDIEAEWSETDACRLETQVRNIEAEAWPLAAERRRAWIYRP